MGPAIGDSDSDFSCSAAEEMPRVQPMRKCRVLQHIPLGVHTYQSDTYSSISDGSDSEGQQSSDTCSESRSSSSSSSGNSTRHGAQPKGRKSAKINHPAAKLRAKKSSSNQKGPK